MHPGTRTGIRFIGHPNYNNSVFRQHPSTYSACNYYYHCQGHRDFFGTTYTCEPFNTLSLSSSQTSSWLTGTNSQHKSTSASPTQSNMSTKVASGKQPNRLRTSSAISASGHSPTKAPIVGSTSIEHAPGASLTGFGLVLGVNALHCLDQHSQDPEAR
ncbi:hypothetical protein PWT90_11217 [Aphanocladium album]|nr:hypothetical protein PWT90_11217 [Aphanocladium album]